MKKSVIKFCSSLTIFAILINCLIGFSGILIFADTESVEIVNLRTAYEKHYRNADGTMTAIIHSFPLHFYENGNWKEFDNTLISDKSGNFINKSSSFDVTLSSEVTVEKTKTSSLKNTSMAQIEYNGYKISYDMIDLTGLSKSQSSKMEIISKEDNNKKDNSFQSKKISEDINSLLEKIVSEVNYNNLYDGVNVELKILPDSIKEYIILNDMKAYSEQFSYYINTNGLSAQIRKDGQIDFFETEEDIIFTIPPVFMFDSSEKAENNYDIETRFEPFKDGYLLTIIPDSKWISSEERVYPITIDPTISVDNNNDTYVLQATPTTNYSNDTQLLVGYSSGQRAETLVGCNANFSTINTITRATLNLYQSASTILTVKAGNNLGIWYHTSSMYTPVNWNNKPTVNYGYATTTTKSGYNSIDITPAAQLWANATNGVMLGCPSFGINVAPSTLTSNRAHFVSKNANIPSQAPYYIIEYNNLPDNGKISDSRWNCYGYALQAYAYNSTSYKHFPGEFYAKSIGLPISINDKTTQDSLWNRHYRYANPYYDSNYLNFVEEYVKKDLNVLGYSCTTVSPNSYDITQLQPDERMIALVVDNSNRDYHFYVRNIYGNWTHKQGNTQIKNTKIGDNNTYLTDSNMFISSGSATIAGDYKLGPVFLVIKKDDTINQQYERQYGSPIYGQFGQWGQFGHPNNQN